MTAKQVDYGTIRNDFVYGEKNEDGIQIYPNCETLGKKYGVKGQTIRRRCNKEKWRDLREVVKLESLALADAAFRDKMAGELTRVDMLSFTVAMKGMQKIQKGLDEVSNKDARSINCLAVAARVFLDIAHRAAGKTKTDFAAILKVERKTITQDVKIATEQVVQAVMKFAPKDSDVDIIISALEKAESGGL